MLGLEIFIKLSFDSCYHHLNKIEAFPPVSTLNAIREIVIFVKDQKAPNRSSCSAVLALASINALIFLILTIKKEDISQENVCVDAMNVTIS